MQTTKYVHTSNVHNLTSPNIIVPHLLEVFSPKSVLDVGCGIGTWLHVFASYGIEIFGLDGDFVNREQLAENIPLEKFQPCDLQNPFDLQKKFDLVICLEVAEHLPASSAKGFVRSICRHSDMVVFSAAIPGQGGQNHLNEQWLDYWRDLFEAEGYLLSDILRGVFWNNANVDWWYKQNMVIFSKSLFKSDYPALSITNVVHPELFHQHLDYIVYLQGYVNELETKLYEK